MPHFEAPKLYSCGKYCEKRRNCLQQAISPFLTMFSILYDTFFIILNAIRLQFVSIWTSLNFCRLVMGQSHKPSSYNREVSIQWPGLTNIQRLTEEIKPTLPKYWLREKDSPNRNHYATRYCNTVKLLCYILHNEPFYHTSPSFNATGNEHSEYLGCNWWSNVHQINA